MASPVGHLLAGQIAYRAVGTAAGVRDRGLAWLCALAAIAPDLDFIPGILLGRPALYHQGASHSFLSALIVSIVLTAFFHRRARRFLVIAWLAIFSAYVSHLGLDLLGPDRRPPYGIPLFWPWSAETYLSPVQVFPGVHHATRTGVVTGEWLARTLSARNLLGPVMECAVLGPPFLVAELWARRRARMAKLQESSK